MPSSGTSSNTYCVPLSAAQRFLENGLMGKMDLVYRDLHLKAGEELVEAGCDQDSPTRHSARHYDVTVRFYNNCHEQIDVGDVRTLWIYYLGCGEFASIIAYENPHWLLHAQRQHAVTAYSQWSLHAALLQRFKFLLDVDSFFARTYSC